MHMACWTKEQKSSNCSLGSKWLTSTCTVDFQDHLIAECNSHHLTSLSQKVVPTMGHVLGRGPTIFGFGLANFFPALSHSMVKSFSKTLKDNLLGPAATFTSKNFCACCTNTTKTMKAIWVQNCFVFCLGQVLELFLFFVLPCVFQWCSFIFLAFSMVSTISLVVHCFSFMFSCVFLHVPHLFLGFSFGFSSLSSLFPCFSLGFLHLPHLAFVFHSFDFHWFSLIYSHFFPNA